MITDVAWDFDGTLCDSYPFILNNFRTALSEVGIHDDELWIQKRVEVSVTSAASQYAAEHGVPEAEILSHFHRYDQIPDFQMVKPYPGVLSTLALVKELGGRNHLYTHRHHEVFAYLSEFGMDRLLDSMITSDDGFPPKPAPDALLSLRKRYAIPEGLLLMIGDRPIDIDAGWNAGCATCLFNSHHFPAVEHATYTVDSYQELKPILRTILSR